MTTTQTHTHTHTNPNEKERASSSKMNQQITLAEPFARQKNNNNKNQLKTNINNEKERASPLKISQQRDSLGRTTCMTRRRKSKICTQRSTDCLFCSLGSLSRTTWYMLMLLPIRARNCKIKNGQNHLVFLSLFFKVLMNLFYPSAFYFNSNHRQHLNDPKHNLACSFSTTCQHILNITMVMSLHITKSIK